MKVARKWIVGAAAVGALVLASAPWSLSAIAVRFEVSRQIRESTGLLAEVDGRAVIALLPRPRVKIERVRIQDRDGNLRIEAEQLRGELRVLPIFAGRLELASATLLSPKIVLDLDANPFTDQGVIARAIDRDASAEQGKSERLGKVTINSGAARIISARRRIDANLEIPNLDIDWPRLDGPASVNGVVAAAGESAEIAAWIGRPVELLRGRKSDLSLRVREPRVSFSFNGAMDQTPAPVIEGSFTGSIPDLRKLADAFDRALPLPGPLRGAALAGALRLGPKSLSLSNLRLSIDGNAYEGAIAFDADRDRPLLSGTLATDALDAAPFTADIPRLVEANGEWGRMRFPPPAEGALDVDLRLSATRARLGRAQLREAAFTLRSEPGRLAVTLEEAKAWNGLVKAQVSARPSASAYALRAVATLARVDAAAMLGEVFRTPRVSGEMNGEIDFSTEGDTLGRALRGLSGMARIAVNKGDVAGLDLEQALRRLEKRPLSVASEVRSGRTGFDAIDLDLALEAGRASVRRLQARGAGVAFDIKGSIDVPERALDLKLEARQASEAAQASAQGPWLSMDIRGLWNEPELTLDARSLISRSQAAEPLLRGMPTPSDAGANR